MRHAVRVRLVVASSLAGFVATTAWPVRAQSPDHPPFMPTRDVRVVYDVQPEAAPAPQRIVVSFSGNGRLMRIDSPDGQGATILDRDRQLLTIVMNRAHAFMQVPERQSLRSPFLFDASMSFTAAGPGAVNGMKCTRWTVTGAGGNATACITADGVVLSEQGSDSQGARGRLVAQQVTYGPVPAATFQPPSGYDRVAHPEGPGPYERSDGGGAQLGPGAAPPPPAGAPGSPSGTVGGNL